MWKLNRDKCVSCEECVKACPTHVLEMDAGFPRLNDDGNCLECWTCADICPEGAIVLSVDSSAPSGASPDNI